MDQEAARVRAWWVRSASPSARRRGRRPRSRRPSSPSSSGIGVAALTGAVVVAVAAVLSYRLLPHGPATVPSPDVDDVGVPALDEEFALAD